MDISYIVSTYHRPDLLGCCLYSLKAQTHRKFEVIVVDNSVDEEIREQNQQISALDERFTYLYAGLSNCYSSTEMGVRLSCGAYLCFPSDDSYYVPPFGETMLRAGGDNNWALVYCDMLYDRRRGAEGKYGLFEARPVPHYIDKTGFLLRREWFTAFPPGIPPWAGSDGYLIAELMAKHIPHGKVAEMLCVHN